MAVAEGDAICCAELYKESIPLEIQLREDKQVLPMLRHGLVSVSQ
jgi:hypothetical protein